MRTFLGPRAQRAQLLFSREEMLIRHALWIQVIKVLPPREETKLLSERLRINSGPLHTWCERAGSRKRCRDQVRRRGRRAPAIREPASGGREPRARFQGSSLSTGVHPARKPQKAAKGQLALQKEGSPPSTLSTMGPAATWRGCIDEPLFCLRFPLLLSQQGPWSAWRQGRGQRGWGAERNRGPTDT